MESDSHKTRELIARWQGGDRDALEELIVADLPWVTEQVRSRLGPVLRGKAETQDYVQDAMVEILGYLPRLPVENRRRFRSLVARIIENNLRDRHDWHRAKRRDVQRDQRLATAVEPDGEPLGALPKSPTQSASRREEGASLRLALHLLEPLDRLVIVRRDWDGLTFAEIADGLGVGEDAARKRYNKALPKLMQSLARLRAGEVRPPEGGE